MSVLHDDAVESLFSSGVRSRTPTPVVFAVAHPDDEVIGAASRLPALARSLALICVTDGSPANGRDAARQGLSRPQYAAVRREEMERALALAGIAPAQILHLGFPDQEASLDLPGVTREIASHLARLRPEIVVTHPYEGGHPDHDATAFAVHAACRLLREGEKEESPAIVEMTSYHNRGGQIRPCEFLPHPGCVVRTVVLSEKEKRLKQQMLDCHATQQETLSWFPVRVERFRPAPDYDFTRPPHPGRLFYEMFDWGMTGRRWRELAEAALREVEASVPQWR